MQDDQGGKVLTLSQSTTILRYLGTYHAMDNTWYSDPKLRFKIDEFFDLFQVGTFEATSQIIRCKVLKILKNSVIDTDLLICLGYHSPQTK